MRPAWWIALLALLVATAGSAEPPLEVLRADGTRAELALGAEDAALVVHFWASWCPECVEELPELERAAERCPATVRVTAVNVGESLAAAEHFRARHALRLPLLRDPDGMLWRRFARGLPANLIWTHEGLRVLTGSASRAEWEQRLTRLGCAR